MKETQTTYEDEYGQPYADAQGKREEKKNKMVNAVNEFKQKGKVINGVFKSTKVLDDKIDYEGVGNSSSHYAHIFGCGNCSWNGTDECPHGIGVEFKDGKLLEKHTNGICSKRKSWLKDISGVSKGRRVQTLQLVNLYDDMEFSNHLTKHLLKAETKDEESKYSASEIISMKKHIADSIAKIRRQDEGDKVEITNANDKIRQTVIDLESQGESEDGTEIFGE